MRIEEIAENALKLIAESKKQDNLSYNNNDLIELQHILKSGGCLILKKKNLDEPFERNILNLISSLKRLGIEISYESKKKFPTTIESQPPLSPEKQIFEEILSDLLEKESPCIIEPEKICLNCSGRCKSLGF